MYIHVSSSNLNSYPLKAKYYHKWKSFLAEDLDIKILASDITLGHSSLLLFDKKGEGNHMLIWEHELDDV